MRVLLLTAIFWAPPAAAFAQAPDEPKVWTVAASAGLAVTSGNTDTSTVNAAYNVTYDPQARNVVKSEGLLLWSKTEGLVSADRLSLSIRDEYDVTPRAFVFGENLYLRDEFKSISYLIAPGAGLGYKLADSDATKLVVMGGLGGVWEKNPGLDVRASGAVTASEKLTRTLSSTTTLTQSVSSLWKMNDWEDALHTFGIGLAVAMSARMQLKVEVLDTYKNRPPLPTGRKNDVAVLTAIVFTM
jgi:putative salt-induced outer membrane protein YdiY